MTDIESVFEKFHDEFLRFEKVEDKSSERMDLHAFNLLDSLFPDDRRIIAAAEHGEIHLSIKIEDLEKTSISEDQVRDLVRCGVRIGDEYLHMFV